MQIFPIIQPYWVIKVFGEIFEESILIKHLWNNQFGKLNADCDSNTASVEGKRLIDNNSRLLENGITFVDL